MGNFLYRSSTTNHSLEVHKGFDEDFILTDVTLRTTSEELIAIVAEEQYSLFWKITDDNYAAYIKRAKHGMLWVLFKRPEIALNASNHRGVFQEVARTFLQFPVVFVDTGAYKDHIRNELECDTLPALVLQLGDLSDDTQELFNHRMAFEDTAEALSVNIVSSWLDSVLASVAATKTLAA